MISSAFLTKQAHHSQQKKDATVPDLCDYDLCKREPNRVNEGHGLEIPRPKLQCSPKQRRTQELDKRPAIATLTAKRANCENSGRTYSQVLAR